MRSPNSVGGAVDAAIAILTVELSGSMAPAMWATSPSSRSVRRSGPTARSAGRECAYPRSNQEVCDERAGGLRRDGAAGVLGDAAGQRVRSARVPPDGRGAPGTHQLRRGRRDPALPHRRGQQAARDRDELRRRVRDRRVRRAATPAASSSAASPGTSARRRSTVPRTCRCGRGSPTSSTTWWRSVPPRSAGGPSSWPDPGCTWCPRTDRSQAARCSARRTFGPPVVIL